MDKRDRAGEGPWELSSGWAWNKLSTVLPLQYGKALTAALRDGDGSHPVFGSSGEVGRHREAIAPVNSIIVGRKGSAGSVYFSKQASWPIDTAYFTAGSAAVDIRFAYWFLIFRKLGRLDQSTAIPSLSRDIYNEQPIPLAPLPEQRRIVERIDALFAEIADGEAALAEARKGLDLFRRALLKAAVTGELTKDWREANVPNETGAELLAQIRKRRPVAAWSPRADLPKLPDAWVWCAVIEAGNVQLGRQRAPQHHAGDHMRPYLRVANVLENKLDLTDVKQMNFTPEEYKTFELRSGDILLNEGQAPDLLERPAIYRGEIDGCCFQKTLIRFRASNEVLPEFALIVFRHYMRSGRFKKESRITTNIGHLTQVRFVVMEFPLPPLKEQEAIVALFSQLEGQADTSLLNVTDLPLVKQSILKAAFEGRLVPQDPADEPASALLARLRRENNVTAPRRRAAKNAVA